MRQTAWTTALTLSLLAAGCGSNGAGGGSGGAGSGGISGGGTGGAGSGSGGSGGASVGSGGGGGSGGGTADGGAGGTVGSGGAAPSSDAGDGSAAVDAGYSGSDKLVCNPGPDGNGMQDLSQTGIPNPPEITLKPGVKAGTITASANFTSQIYGGYSFPYRIYTSANYVKGQPAVFMTFGDGSEYIDSFHTPTILDNLTATGAVPPTVALFIDPGPNRVPIYDPPTDKYSRFLLTEIIPAVIDPVYSISKDPNAWATGGHSASGEQGWSVLWHSDRYHKFLGHNTSFGAANVAMYGNVDWAKLITDSPKRDLRVSLVNAPVGHDLVDNRGDWTLINEGVARALAAKGNDYRMIIGPGDHGGAANSHPDFPMALRWMFRGCQFAKP